ncbi:MAG: 2-amino-4-hydroxy-6-hydroxymethyldihydropteridine diphosphokinase [Opitutales bacterium]|nr:2-amino-4-hydroxy-6-hydroxymethyldihydropteridine diphosphokinase [Opitutales bacterium]
MTSIALIAMGGNIDNPRRHLESAIEKMRSRGWEIAALSGWHITEPVGYSDQPDFINAVVAVRVPATITPEKLMKWLLATEIEEGRQRPSPVANGPRSCDLDLLFFDREKRDTKELQLPHPRWRERLFVLEPLIEVLEQLDSAEDLLAEAKSAAAALKS